MVGFLKEAKMYFGKKHTKGELKKIFCNSVAKIRNQNLETSSKRKFRSSVASTTSCCIFFWQNLIVIKINCSHLFK